MSQYSQEQIYEAMRRADAAGDGEAVKALAAALKAGASKGEILDIAKARNTTVDEAALDANIASRDAGGPVNTFVRIPSPMQQSNANALAGTAQGVVGAAIDFPLDVAGGVQKGVNALVGHGGAAAMNALGLEDMGAFWKRGAEGLDASLDRRVRLSDKIEEAMPTPEGMGGPRLAAQVLGSMAVPFGPKAVRPVSAPKSPAPITPAQQIVKDGADAKVTVMTSDVRQPKGFTGKVARAVGERIPIAGTGGMRVKQNEERIEAVKTLARDFGADVSEGVLDKVADDLAKTRGGKITALAARKNKIIDDLSKPIEAPNARNSALSDVAQGAKSKPDQITVPELRGHEGSWFVVDRETGKGVTEIFKQDAATAAKVNGAKYELLPAGDYLGRLNKAIKEAGGAQPSPEALRAALGSKAPSPRPAAPTSLSAAPPIGPPIVRTPSAVAEIDRQLSRLMAMNNDAVEPVIRRLRDFKSTLTSGLDLRNVEENRKLLGEAFSDPGLASIKTIGQKAVNAIYAPLRDDMGVFIRENAGEGAFNAWKRSNDELAAMAGELRAKGFKSVLNDAESTPENVAKLLFSQKPSDTRRLFASLSESGKGKARAAIIHRAVEKAGGLETLSPDKFKNAVEALGRPIGVVFEGADKARIEGLLRVLKATSRAAESAAAPPTGVQNSQFIGGGATVAALGTTGAVVATGLAGLAARAYESATVRNLLIGLGKTKPGTPQEASFLQRIEKAMAGQSGINPPAALNDNVGQLAAASAGNNEENRKN